MLVVFLFVVTNSIIGQEDLKHKIQIEAGRPTFLSIARFNGAGVGLHYTYKLNRSFTISSFYNFTAGSTLPVDGRNREQLEERLIGLTLDEFYEELPYQQVRNHMIGAYVSYNFVNNSKWTVGANIGGGYVLHNRSELSRQIQVSTDQNSIVTDFVVLSSKHKTHSPFVRLGLDVDYTSAENVTLGFGINFLAQQNNFEPFGEFIVATHLMPNIKVGKRF